MVRHPTAVVIVLLLVLFVALPGGLLLYPATRPCPEMWMRPGPGTEVVCSWWDSTCKRCY